MVRSELLKSSRILLLLSGVLLLFIIKTPIWRIELNAPQYPEGLALQIHADGIKGDVEIINGYANLRRRSGLGTFLCSQRNVSIRYVKPRGTKNAQGQ